MKHSLRLMLVPGSERLSIAGQAYTVNSTAVVIVPGQQTVQVPAACLLYGFTQAQLQVVYQQIQNLLTMDPLSSCRRFNEAHTIEADPVFLTVAAQLANVDQTAMLSFVLAYCLTVDGGYCSALLRQLISGKDDLFEFLQRNRFESWSVAEYAQAVGLPLHKFNQLFVDQYGITAKQWLLEQRLNHARYLLETTSLKIIEIALSCGFSSSAYFSDSFRRHFQLSPRQIRLAA